MLIHMIITVIRLPHTVMVMAIIIPTIRVIRILRVGILLLIMTMITILATAPIATVTVTSLIFSPGGRPSNPFGSYGSF